MMLVNSYPKEELIRILREYGEEKFAVRIACEIVRAGKKSRSKPPSSWWS